MEKRDITKYLEKKVSYNGHPYILKSVAIKRDPKDITKLVYVAEIQDYKQPKSFTYTDLYKINVV